LGVGVVILAIRASRRRGSERARPVQRRRVGCRVVVGVITTRA
jgi:hypothetical protein